LYTASRAWLFWRPLLIAELARCFQAPKIRRSGKKIRKGYAVGKSGVALTTNIGSIPNRSAAVAIGGLHDSRRH
jgi:hypothetical protein